MKKVLFLDDDTNRTRKFQQFVLDKELNKDHAIYYATTAAGAIKLLTEHKFYAMHLDHDLGGKTFVVDIEETGYEVALWIEENIEPDENAPEYIVLHSYNPQGAKRMAAALQKLKGRTQVYFVPFDY